MDNLSAIISDVQDGQLNGNYSQAEIMAALHSPLLKVYGGTAAVETVQASISRPVNKANSSDLPFTGMDAVSFVVIGGILIVAGYFLRRDTRRRMV